MMKNPLEMRRTDITKKPLYRRLYEYRYMYLMLIPALTVMFIFCYGPMYGIQIAFKDFKPRAGILGSEWLGFNYFARMFREYTFTSVLINSITISLAKLIVCFPAGVIFALLLNEITNARFKKFAQTVSYIPHFISWVVAGSIIKSIFSLSGPFNQLLSVFGYGSEMWMSKSNAFIPILLFSDIWKNMGWGSIVYLAAIAGIPSDQYESAEIDGANRLQRIWYITLPSIIPLVMTMFILRIGGIMNAGFDQIFNLYSAAVYDVADIIDTYSYRVGLLDHSFSYSSAIGLFKNVVGFILMMLVNSLSRSRNKGAV